MHYVDGVSELGSNSAARAAARGPTPKGDGFEAERSSALMIGLLHFCVVFAGPALLWNSTIVGRTSLIAWSIAEALIGVVSLAGYFSVRSGNMQRFALLTRAENIGTACTFAVLPWLGASMASTTPSKHILIIALVAVTSISAANSSHITRRRPFFGLLVVVVATSYFGSFMVAGEYVFAMIALLWCLSIATITRVGYRSMLELLELRKASERTARHDDLTGLLSRSAFFETLNLAACQPIAWRDGQQLQPVLVLFDLDGFKAINDSFGHGVGDSVLQTVAKRLILFLPPDASIGRLGGDEFAAVFTTTESELATSVQAALSAVGDPIRTSDRELYVAASAGWTVVELGEESPDLMAQADAAMYQSKNSETVTSSGFDTDLRAELDRSLDMRQRFRTALKRNEISFWAQPLTRIYDRAPVAVELLARWPQDDETVIGPIEFTRVADETGLAVELDRQALRAAASLLALWEADPILGSILVKANISPVHLHNGQLIKSVRELIPTSALPRLGLEFVESRLITAAERNHLQLRDLREMGITISIDDFGVGYSSLTYLRSLPVSEIKIDRSFVTDVDSDRINQGLVRAIVDIASTLGLPTVAEGIETVAEFEAIAQLGVSLGQGYFIGHPCPIDQVEHQLRRLHHIAIDAKPAPQPNETEPPESTAGAAEAVIIAGS